MELLLLDALGQLLLALDRQRAVVHRDVDVLARHIRKFRLDHHLVVAVLKNVDRRHPCAGRHQPFIAPVRVIEHPVDTFLQLGELTKRVIPANDCHCIPPFHSCGPLRETPTVLRYFVSAYSASTTSASFTEPCEPCEPSDDL